MAAKTDPSTTSSDYDAMKPYGDMVDTILAGAPAMRSAGRTYLPQFPEESDVDYEYRRANAKFTNVYADIVSNLAAKPFSEEVQLAEGADKRFEALAEDIDGRGNNLHVFAHNLFFGGINYAVDWILVDFTKARPRTDGQPLSLDDEKKQGLRPYWVHVPASRMLAVYTDTIAGKEEFVHARMRETVTRRDGFGEVCVERIRVLNREPIYEVVDDVTTGRIVDYEPATFEVWEKVVRQRTRSQSSQWGVVEQGKVTIGVIALVPFVTGRRIEGSWQFVPPMQDVAHLQIEHYQQETALKSIKELTAFPMLAANGVDLSGYANDRGGFTIAVGPRSVLSAPPIMGDSSATHGEWTFIEPTAENVRFLADDVANTEKQLRELGRQPLTATAGITVVTAAIAAQKASSAVQAWAWGLKDALEQAFKLTAMWLNMKGKAPEVVVFTDFALEVADEKGPDWIRDMAKRNRLSTRTEWEEAQRRGVLSGDFDADQEDKRLAEEAPDEDDEEEIGAAAA